MTLIFCKFLLDGIGFVLVAMLPCAPPRPLTRARSFSGIAGPLLVAGMEMELAYQFDVWRAVTGGRVELCQILFRLSVIQVTSLSLIRL